MPRLRKPILRGPLLLTGAMGLTAVLSLGFAGCSTSEPGEEGCVSTEQFFATQVWAQTIQTKCVACHISSGEARDTQLVFKSSAEAGYLSANLDIIRKVAQIEQNGESILLQKPLGRLEHGGKVQLEESSPEYQDLVKLVEKFDSPD